MKKFLTYLFYGFWIFLFGCVFGFIFETTLEFLKHGVWIPRAGLIYGPFSQVYGLGALVFSITLYQIKKPIPLFLTGTIAGGIAEYMMSLIQEYVFGTISWDYSKYFLNFNGRTSLFHAICWGIIGFAFTKWMLPFLFRMIENLKNKLGYIITIFLAVFLIFDIFISITACMRQEERKYHLRPDNAFEEFLDQHYPDDRINAVYNNTQYRKKTNIPN